jgi:rhodanese-related sulfurtransferase
MKHLTVILTVWLLLSVILTGCAGKTAGTGVTPTPVATTVTELSPTEARDLLRDKAGDNGFSVIDVRTPEEFTGGHIEGAQNIDVNAADFEASIGKLDRTKSYLVYCRSGKRSQTAVEVFKKLGFPRVYHLTAGISGWQAAGLPVVQ